MKKYIIYFLIILLTIFLFTSCNSNKVNNNNENNDITNNPNTQNNFEENNKENITTNNTIKDYNKLYDFINNNITKISKDDFKNFTISYYDITNDGQSEVFVYNPSDIRLYDEIIVLEQKNDKFIELSSNISIPSQNYTLEFESNFVIIKYTETISDTYKAYINIYTYNNSKINNVLSDLLIEYKTNKNEKINKKAEIDGNYDDFVYTLLVSNQSQEITYSEKSIQYTYDHENNSYDITKIIREVPDLEDISKTNFNNLKKSIVLGNWKVIPTEWCTVKKANASFDLNSDGKEDNIEFNIFYDKESTLVINDSKLNFNIENAAGVYFVDLDSSDKYTEIAITATGPSADPTTTFFRYADSKIINMGLVEADIYSSDDSILYFGNILTDNNGVLIPPQKIARFINPNIYKSFMIIRNHKLVTINLDTEKQLNNTFVFNTDFMAFFEETNNTENFVMNFDPSKQVPFYKDSSVKILDINKHWYFIELEDGKKGIMYFFIGD